MTSGLPRTSRHIPLGSTTVDADRRPLSAPQPRPYRGPRPPGARLLAPAAANSLGEFLSRPDPCSLLPANRAWPCARLRWSATYWSCFLKKTGFALENGPGWCKPDRSAPAVSWQVLLTKRPMRPLRLLPACSPPAQPPWDLSRTSPKAR